MSTSAASSRHAVTDELLPLTLAGLTLDRGVHVCADLLFLLARVLSALLLTPIGAAIIVEMAASNTLLQAMVPDALRGRVMARALGSSRCACRRSGTKRAS